MEIFCSSFWQIQIVFEFRHASILNRFQLYLKKMFDFWSIFGFLNLPSPWLPQAETVVNAMIAIENFILMLYLFICIFIV